MTMDSLISRSTWTTYRDGRVSRAQVTLEQQCESKDLSKQSHCQANKKSPWWKSSGALNKSLAVTYFHMGRPHTIIGAKRFHFRVRNGIGWFTFAIAAKQIVVCLLSINNEQIIRKFWNKYTAFASYHHHSTQTAWVLYGQVSRAISTG